MAMHDSVEKCAASPSIVLIASMLTATLCAGADKRAQSVFAKPPSSLPSLRHEPVGDLQQKYDALLLEHKLQQAELSRLQCINKGLAKRDCAQKDRLQALRAKNSSPSLDRPSQLAEHLQLLSGLRQPLEDAAACLQQALVPADAFTDYVSLPHVLECLGGLALSKCIRCSSVVNGVGGGHSFLLQLCCAAADCSQSLIVLNAASNECRWRMVCLSCKDLHEGCALAPQRRHLHLWRFGGRLTSAWTCQINFVHVQALSCVC